MESLKTSAGVIDMVCILFVGIFCYFAVKCWRKERGNPPGPLRLPLLGHLHLLGSLPHQSLSDLSKMHGPLMMLKLGNIPLVVVSSVALARELITNHDLSFASRPKLTAPKHMMYDLRDVAWSEYGPYWRQVRKICTMELFTVRRMEQSKRIRSEELMLLLRSILNSEEAVDIHSELSAVSMNVIMRMALNTKLVGGDFLDKVQEAITLLMSFHAGDFFPILSWIDHLSSIPRIRKTHKQIDLILQGIVDEHRGKSNAYQQDIVDVMIALEGVEDECIKAVILDMITAGTDTSSVTAEWALSELLRNPNLLARAQQELDSVVGQDRLVTEDDLPELAYLKAIVKETLRLHPALPLLLPREAKQNVKFGGYNVAKNARLVINVWSIGRDKLVWGESAADFNPERFYENSVDVKGHDFELIPFGSGRRICPGLSLGLCMVELMLAHMIQAFEWRTSMSIDVEEEAGVTLRRKFPLKAFAKPRLSPSLYK